MLETLLASRVRAKLLSAFFLSPGLKQTAWELAHSLPETYSAVWKELHRLEGVGILKSAPRGHARVYEVNPTCPIAPELRSIVLKTAGIGAVLRDHLQVLGTVREAYIYGSFASGEADKHSDIDVMVIGEVELESLAEVIATAEQKLNRPINYAVFSEREWAEKLTQEDAFATNVIRSPRIPLIGGEHAV